MSVKTKQCRRCLTSHLNRIPLYIMVTPRYAVAFVIIHPQESKWETRGCPFDNCCFVNEHNRTVYMGLTIIYSVIIRILKPPLVVASGASSKAVNLLLGIYLSRSDYLWGFLLGPVL